MDSTELPNQRPIMKILQIICFHKQGTNQGDIFIYLYKYVYVYLCNMHFLRKPYQKRCIWPKNVL